MLDRTPHLRGKADRIDVDLERGGSMVAIRDLAAFLNQNSKVILTCVAAMLTLALLYLSIAKPQFTGIATVFIESPRVQSLRDDVGASPTRDNPTLESHAEILRSDKIALAVIEQQKLLADPEFSGTSKGWRTRVAEIFTGAAPIKPPTAIDLVDVFRNRLNVKRVGQSYVIETSFRSRDRNKAARLANAVVDAYMREQINAKTEAAKLGAEWLEGRVADLRKQATSAARAVQDFKTRSDIVDQRRAQLDLSELESAAEMYKLVYAGYLQKLTETIQQQSVPLTESRILNAALVPNEPSHPKSKLILALAGLVGLLGGIGLGILRQSIGGRPFVSESQLVESGLEVLGRIPDGSRERIGRSGMLFNAVSAPDSRFADGFRNVKTMMDVIQKKQEGFPVVVGISSAAPLEGRTTIALNLALTLAQSGRRTAIVDGDSSHVGSITRSIAPHCNAGLIDILHKSVGSQEIAVSVCPDCDVIPIASASNSVRPIDFFTSDQALAVFAALKSHYDMVIVDLPPPSRLDPHASLGCLDGVLFVAQPGRASIDQIKALGQTFRHSNIHVLGAVVNLGGRRRRGRELSRFLLATAAAGFRKGRLRLAQRWKQRSSSQASKTV